MTRCQVVNLYHGGQYKLYKYRKYSDVRLIFSPGVQTAFFGGDPDNFNFPRYDLDSRLRAPLRERRAGRTPDHLKWNAAPPKAGEPVFVAGNPGRHRPPADDGAARDAARPDAAGDGAALFRAARTAAPLQRGKRRKIAASPRTCCSGSRTATRFITAACSR